MKTLVEASGEALEELNSPKWREPRHAYILLEMPKIMCRAGQEPKREMSTMVINVQNRPDVGHKLIQYMKKGARILHYGNFPQSNDPRPEVANLVKLYSGGKRNPWDMLAGEVRGMIGLDAQKYAAAEAHYSAKVAALEAKIAALESKKGSKAPANE